VHGFLQVVFTTSHCKVLDALLEYNEDNKALTMYKGNIPYESFCKVVKMFCFCSVNSLVFNRLTTEFFPVEVTLSLWIP